jgi:hypothetical protein
MDAVLSWEALKIGGIMLFDDYQWYHFETASKNPKVAIDGFLASYQGMYEILYTCYQMHIRKTSETINL